MRQMYETYAPFLSRDGQFFSEALRIKLNWV